MNACSFLGLYSVEIKSDDGYQIRRRISSDNHHLILHHLSSFIQWEPEEIMRWVITADSHRAKQNTRNAIPRSKKLNKILSFYTNVSSFLHNLQRQSRFDVLEQLCLFYMMRTNEFVLKYCKYVSYKWRWHRQPSCSSWLKTQGEWEGSHMNINTCLFCYNIDKIDMCWCCYLWQPL